MNSMERTYRTIEETIVYFKQLAYDFETESHRHGEDKYLKGKSEAYAIAAFELEKNLQKPY
jgi:hypothetical protein